MSDHIEAVLFDMGGTLRSSDRQSRAHQLASIRRIIELLGTDVPVDEFARLLSKRANAYKRWAEKTLIELNEGDLWTKWMLPDWPEGQIRKIAVQLNQAYRDAIGRRVIFPETRDVILQLFRRGYRLGLVSNTTSSVEAPAALKELGLTGLFETVVLSAVVGKRKPDPAILLDATTRMGVRPEDCAYIGDRPDRDVAAARKAGFSRAILIRSSSLSNLLPGADRSLEPDHYIDNLNELFEIFPPNHLEPPARIYDASLSTMWAMKNVPTLADFFEISRRLAFARIELNHQINSDMLAGIDLGQYCFSSVHEPCPADISAETLKMQDLLVSSTNEERRRKGVDAIKRSIDLAHRLAAPAVVIHVGGIYVEMELEKKLRALFQAGQQDSDEYREIFARMVGNRRRLAGAGFESVKNSMLELLEYAAPLGIRLGVENRYHYMEFPSPDELEELLNLAGPDRIGFIYDVGHAQTLDRLGFYAHEDWLKRFGPRIIGTHLHDVIGTVDHYAPGLGEVDFAMVASYLPAGAFRTCEFQGTNTPEQVRAGLQFLLEHNCIKILD